jgi:hypothetical protein
MYRCFKAFLGVLRQRSLEVEQPIRNRQVMGSTPIVGSMDAHPKTPQYA